MDRRGFLKIFGSGVAATIFVPKTIIESPWQKRIIETPTWAETIKVQEIGRKLLFDDQEKELIMTAVMADAQERLTLAQVMAEPIKVALEYRDIGRKLLLVDELPQSAIPRYEKDVFSVAHKIMNHF